MRVAVMGSGAVGGYFGAKLASAGNQVSFIARGKHLAAMQEHGLKITSPIRDLHIRNAQFTTDARSVGGVDLVLFCVKSYDTEVAGRSIAPLISDQTMILSLQNGIDNPDKLARLYGQKRVFATVVYVGAQVVAPGVIAHSTGGKIIFGQPDGKDPQSALALTRTLTNAGIPCEQNADIRKVQWTKLLWNAPFCAISCLTHANMKQILESQLLTQLALACMAEVQTAARTDAVDLPRQLFDDTLAFSRGLGEFKPSMLQDLEAEKPLEYEAFNGIVVKLLETAGQAAPINRTFFAMLHFIDQKLRAKAGF
jgi:2-dehydropantoate 2-reductase